FYIQRLNLDDNKMEIVLNDDDHDLLSPRMRADGSLYFIRRPYLANGPGVSPIKVLTDLVLAPFRLIRALAHFLNFFSLMFSQKPLMTAGGPPKEGPDERFMMLWGRLVDTQAALKKA